jgi:hypothetical protein
MGDRAQYEIEAQIKSSLSVKVGLERLLYQPEEVADVPAATDGHSELEMFVILTDHSGVRAAAGMADHLGEKLDACPQLLMLHEAP